MDAESTQNLVEFIERVADALERIAATQERVVAIQEWMVTEMMKHHPDGAATGPQSPN